MSEEQTKTKAGMGLGIAGLVLGILALVFSFIPCLGMYAMFPGALAIIFAAIALYQANKGNGSKGMIIAGLVVSIIATIIAIYQMMVVGAAVEEGAESFQDMIKQAQIESQRQLDSIQKANEAQYEEAPAAMDSTATDSI